MNTYHKTKTSIIRSLTNEGDNAKTEHFIFNSGFFDEDIIFIIRLTLVNSLQRKMEYENSGHKCVKSFKNLHLMSITTTFKLSTFDKIVDTYYK